MKSRSQAFRATAGYVINGKAKRYRVSDKNRRSDGREFREHNYHPESPSRRGCAGAPFYRSGDPGSEKDQLTRVANYLSVQARQRGYQLLIACSGRSAG